MKQLTIHLPSVAPLEFYPGEQPHLPALEMLCSRGAAQPFALKGESAIFEATAMVDISYARQRLAGEEQQPENGDSGFWYCADPVYLKADRDQVLLSHPASIQIQEREADSLIGAFNQLFKDDGLQLWRAMVGKGGTERWYLRSEKPWQLSSTPLDRVEGRTIRDCMPQGENAQRWRKVIVESEMLFFSNPVNQQRSRTGKPLISSLWLWGEHKQQCASHQSCDMLVGAHPLLKGVNRLLCTPLLALSSSFDELISRSGNGLMIIDDLLQQQRVGTHHDILLLLKELEQQLFAPALEALKQGKIKELKIQPANGSIYTIRRPYLMRFWRMPKMVWYEG